MNYMRAIILSALSLLLVTTISVSAAWTPAPANPPSNNAPEPINVSGSTQLKAGNLFLNSQLLYDLGLVVFGRSVFGFGEAGLDDNEPEVSINGRIKIRGGTPAVDSILSSVNNEGLALWQPFSALWQKCVQSGACTAGGTSLTPGTVEGQMLRWDNSTAGKKWTPTLGVFITKDPVTGAERLGVGNAASQGEMLYVAGKANIQGTVKIITGSPIQEGYVFTTNKDGIGDWKPLPAVAGGGQWATVGNNIYNANTGNVGIGTQNPTAKLDVAGDILVQNENDLLIGNSYRQAKLHKGIIGLTNGFDSLDIFGAARSGARQLVRIFDVLLVPDLWVTNICNGSGANCINFNNLGLPTATAGQTLYHNGTTWRPMSTLLATNNGSSLSIQGNTQVVASSTFQVSRLQITPSANPDGSVNHGTGKVLVSDNSGFGRWVATSSLNIVPEEDYNWQRINYSGRDIIINRNPDNVIIGGADKNVGPASYPNGATSKVTIRRDVAENVGADLILLQTKSTTQAGNSAMISFAESMTANHGYWSIGKKTSGNDASVANNFFIGVKDSSDPGIVRSIFNITPAGRIGIGTQTPTANLDVVGGANFSGGIVANGLASRGNVLIDNNSSDGGRLIWKGGAAGDQEYRARVRTDGALSFFPGEGTIESLIIKRDGVVQIDKIENNNLLDASKVTADSITTKSLTVTNSGNLAVPKTGYVLAARNDSGLLEWTDPKTLVAAGDTLPTGAADQTLRYDNNAWVGTNDLKVSDAGDVTLAKNLQVLGSSITVGNQGIFGGLAIGILGAPTAKLDVNGQVRIRGGAPANNRILVSDDNGLATWKDASAIPGLTTDNDKQTLSFTNNNLAISGGNSVPLYTIGTGLGLLGNSLSAQNTQALWNANQLQGRSVVATAPTNGQVLKWNGTAWAPSAETLSGLPTNAAANQTLRYTGTAWDTNGTALVTDGNKVGVGTTNLTAAEKLRVVGGISADTLKINNSMSRLGWATILTDGTVNAASTESIMNRCEWNNPSGSNYNRNCDVGGISNPVPNPTVTNGDYLFYCPDEYSVVSGGGWCDDDYYLRESRPESVDGGANDAWKISCQKNGVLTPSRARPGGASLMCAPN